MEELEQPDISGSKSEFGKFKDAESLLKAYANLEAEFTKKSQKLATLEDEKSKNDEKINRQAEIERKVNEFVTKFESVKPFSSALKETLTLKQDADLNEEGLRLLSKNYKQASDYAEDSEFLNNYIFSNKEIKDKIVKEYLSNISQNGPIKVNAGASSISLTPPKVPATIKEAGALAKTIIKQK